MSSLLRRGMLQLSSTSWFPSFLSMLEGTSRYRHGAFHVLTYHRVNTSEASPDLYPGTLSTTPAEFREQLEQLQSQRIRFVELQDVLDALELGRPLPPRAVLVTFDDAYQDFQEHAWPVLRDLNIPVVLFVPTAFPDNPQLQFWWDQVWYVLNHWPTDRELASPVGNLALSDPQSRNMAMRKLRDYIKSLPADEAMEAVHRIRGDAALPPRNHVLSWGALRELARQGVTLAAHTRTHPLVHRISVEMACDEVLGSLRDLREQIADVPSVFAYPSGAFSASVVAMLRSEGVRAAFTTCRGANLPGKCDPLLLRRIGVGGNTNSSLIRAQMLPVVSRLLALKTVQSAV